MIKSNLKGYLKDEKGFDLLSIFFAFAAIIIFFAYIIVYIPMVSDQFTLLNNIAGGTFIKVMLEWIPLGVFAIIVFYLVRRNQGNQGYS